MKTPLFQTVRLLNADSSKKVPVKQDNKNNSVVYWKDIENKFEGIPLSLYTNVRFERGRDKKLLEPLRIKHQLSDIVVQEETSSGTDIQHALNIINCNVNAVNSNVLECCERLLNEHKKLQAMIGDVLERNNAIFRAIFELQEYSIPRLFILLPQRVSKLNPSRYLEDNFRLYFLCECGETTTTTNGNISHKMHFARHEGYELRRPTEFMRKYGPYVMRLLTVIQNLSKIGSVAIPVLDLTDLCSEVREWLDITNQGILPLVDVTSKYLIENVPSVSDGFTDEYLQAPNGPELRGLNAFIAGKDDGQALGNLNRTLTPEGKVKWICNEHFQENVKNWDFVAFRSSITQFNGKLELSLARVTVNLKLETVDKFYEIFAGHTAFIQELVINMEWKPTTDHLKKLRNAIKHSNVERLDVYCKPEKDLSNRSIINSISLPCRAYPLMQLMSVANRPPIGRLRKLVVHGLHDVLRDSKYIPASNQLHTLGMDRKAFNWNDKGKLFDLLLGAPHLTKLTLSSDTLYMARKMAEELANKAPRLIIVEIDTESNDYAVFHIGSGKIMTVDVTLGNAKLKEVANWSDIENLKVGYRVEQNIHGQILQELISNCQHLTSLEIECPVVNFCSMFQLLSGAAEDHPTFKSICFHDTESELLTTDIKNAFKTTTLQLKPEDEPLMSFDPSFRLFGWVPLKAVVSTPMTDNQMATLNERLRLDKTPSRLQELHLNISLLTSEGLSLLETLLGWLKLKALKLIGSNESSQELLDIITTHAEKLIGFDLTLQLLHHNIPRTFETIQRAVRHVDGARLCLSSPAIVVEIPNLQRPLVASTEILQEDAIFDFSFSRLFGCFPSILNCTTCFDDNDIQILEEMTTSNAARLQFLKVNIDALSEHGLHKLATVVTESASLIVLHVWADYRKDSAVRAQEKNRFISTIASRITELWLSDITFEGAAMPPQFDMPLLRSFELHHDESETSLECAQWIASISSSPNLKILVLKDVKLRSDLWELIIGRVNFKSLEEVYFKFSSLNAGHLKSIADRIPQDAPLKYIFTGGKGLVVNKEEEEQYKNQIKEKTTDCEVRHHWYYTK